MIVSKIAPPKTKEELIRERLETLAREKASVEKEAIDALLAHIPKGPYDTEQIPIQKAVGRVISEEVVALMDDPPYSKSCVDGYMLLSSGTALASPQKPMTFEVQGDIPPPSSSVELPFGRAIRVKKGSYMSIKRFLESHYAILQESETQEKENKISVTRFIDKHENISIQGSVFKLGRIIFPKGHRIQSQDLFTLASQGITTVSVAKRPTVAFFSTGSELIPATDPYRIGFKYDCNACGLSAMLEECGGLSAFQGIMPNTLPPFIDKLAEVIEAKEVAMILISGATFAEGGKFLDHLINGASVVGLTLPGEIVNALKNTVIPADKIRPNVLGVLKKKPIICLAGKPDDAKEGFRVFAQPVLSHLLGEHKI